MNIKDKMSKAKAENIIGIEIDRDYIRIAEVSHDCEGRHLRVVAEARLPENLLPGEREQALVQILGNMIRENNIKARKAIFCLPDSVSFVSNIFLPLIPRDELKEVVRLQAERLCPFPLQNEVLEYYIRAQRKDNEGAKAVDIIMAAAKAEAINAYLSTMQKAGLKVIGVSLKPMALSQGVKSRRSEDSAVAVIDLGAQTTTILIIQEGGMSFVRAINLGTKNIIETIADELKVDSEQARDIAREIGIAVKPEKEKQKQVFLAMRALLERLLNEIDRSFGFYSQQPFRKNIAQVILTGDVAGIKNINNFLAEKLKQPLETKTYAYSGCVSSEGKGEILELDPRFATAIGLADREVLNALNLIPPVFQRVVSRLRKVNVRDMFLKVILPVFVPGLLISYLLLTIIAGSLKHRLVEKENEMAKLKEVISVLESNKPATSLEKQIASLEKLIQERLFWSKIIKEISSLIISDSLWIRHFSYEKGVLTLGGSAFSQSLVTEFILRLSRADRFKEVSLGGDQEGIRDNYKVVDFEIKCTFK